MAEVVAEVVAGAEVVSDVSGDLDSLIGVFKV
jgi:hypothetical protein